MERTKVFLKMNYSIATFAIRLFLNAAEQFLRRVFTIFSEQLSTPTAQNFRGSSQLETNFRSKLQINGVSQRLCQAT